MRYSIEPRDRIYVKGYGFLSFAKNMGKSVSNKYGQKLLDSDKKSTTDAIKTTSKRAIQKPAEATGDLIGNKSVTNNKCYEKMVLMLLIHLILKQKITGQTTSDDNNGNIARRVDVEIMVPLKYQSNFWRTIEMPSINCEVELILAWSSGCVIIYTDVANQVSTFTIIETNLYVHVVTLSTQDNAKLLPKLKSGFKNNKLE